MTRIILLLMFPLATKSQENYALLLDSHLKAKESVQGFSGNVLIVKNNRPVLRKAYGLSDRERGLPTALSHRYCIGALTQHFTATYILQLQQEGKLHVQDRISKYFPGSHSADSITLHMLLNNTSGIADYTSVHKFMTRIAPIRTSPDSVLRSFERTPLVSQPGSRWELSNSNYILLGLVIEKAPGEKYDDYLANHIFKSLRMYDSGSDDDFKVIKNRARPYQRINAEYVNGINFSATWLYSATNFFSTVDDLYKWEIAQQENKILTKASKDQTYSQYLGKYGYGIFVDSLLNRKRIGNADGILGFQARMDRFPDEKLYVIVMSNVDVPDLEGVSPALAAIMFGEDVELPYFHHEMRINSTELDKLVGRYKSVNFGSEITKKQDQLFQRSAGTEDRELVPESEMRFFLQGRRCPQNEFIEGEKGVVTKVFQIENGIKFLLRKI